MAKAKAKQGFKRKRSKTALPVWAAAGVSLAITGGASANAPATDMPSEDSGKRILLAEEEVFDVSLGTFYVFDKEREFSPGVRLAGGRCGGCGGCGAHVGGCGGCHIGGCGCAARGCRGCGGCGCGVGVGLLLGGLLGGCGGCGGCGGGYGTCWVWSPAWGRWINVCY
jgi:hypothetical protein